MAVPALQYLVGFSNPALTDPAVISAVASPPGTLGTAGQWTDITRYVAHDSGARGRNHDYAQFEAGTRSLILRNDDGRFTPWNTSGPYTGHVVPRLLVQVRAVWSAVTYTRFTGVVVGWTTHWPDATSQTVTVDLSDMLRVFNTGLLSGDVYQNMVLADRPAGFWLCADQSHGGTASFPTLADTTAANHPIQATGPLGNLDQLGIAGPFASSPNTAAAQTTPRTWSSTTAYLPANQPFSVEMWINTTFNTMKVWSQDNSGGVAPQMQVLASGKILFWNATPTAGSAVAVNDGAWHHVVGTFTPTTYTTFVDGVQSEQHAEVVGSWSGSNLFGFGIGYGGSFADIAVYQYTLSATQAAAHYRAAVQTFPQERSDSRILGALAVAAFPATAYNLDVGSSTVQASAGLSTTSVLQHLQEVEATELGALYMTTAGVARFVSRANLWSNTLYRSVQATFGDNTAGGDIPYEPGVELPYSDLDIYNDGQATRTGGVQQETVNNASVAVYGRQTWTPAAAILQTGDTEVLNMVGVVVGKYSYPVPRIQQITVNLAAVAGSLPAVIPTLLSLDVLQRVTVERTLMPGAGTAFSEIANIEKISEDIDAASGSWTITFELAKPDLTWVLDVSQLDYDTQLGY